MEAVRGKKPLYLGANFGTFSQLLVHPTVPVLLTKDLPKVRSDITFSLHISNSITKPAKLDYYYTLFWSIKMSKQQKKV